MYAFVEERLLPPTAVDDAIDEIIKLRAVALSVSEDAEELPVAVAVAVLVVLLVCRKFKAESNAALVLVAGALLASLVAPPNPRGLAFLFTAAPSSKLMAMA